MEKINRRQFISQFGLATAAMCVSPRFAFAKPLASDKKIRLGSRHRRFYLRFLFFHPDYTVGFGIAPNHAPCARGLYRRSGITPCPEDIVILLSFIICIAL